MGKIQKKLKFFQFFQRFTSKSLSQQHTNTCTRRRIVRPPGKPTGFIFLLTTFYDMIKQMEANYEEYQL